MKKILPFLILLLVLGAAIYFLWEMVFSEGDPGYVIIGINHWSLETSLAVFMLIIGLCFLCLYVLFRLLGWLYRIPGKAKSKAKVNTVNRSQDALISGLVDSAEGNWERAEKTLIKHAATSSAPLIHYLTAARAAHSRGAMANRDEYLDLASNKAPGSEMAIGLTHAELCLSQQQYDQALKILTRLQAINPEHASVLKLLHQTNVQLGDWKAVKELMPSLAKNELLTEAELTALQIESFTGLLKNAGQTGNIEQVVGVWGLVPEPIQKSLASEFYSAMILAGAGDRVEEDIVSSLAKEWNQELLILYGSISNIDTEKQLIVAEQWAELNPRDAVLMRVLGKLHIKAGNYERADSCLTKSISLQPSVVAEQLLGELMFAQGNQDRAVELFKSGLALASNEVITPVELNDSVDIPKVEPPVEAVPEAEPVVVLENDASESVAPVATTGAVVVAATTMDVALGLSKEEIPTEKDAVDSIVKTPAETIEQPQSQSSETQESAKIELSQPTESIESSPIVEPVPVVSPEIDTTSNSQADTMTEAMATVTVTEEPTSTESVVQTPVEETKPEPEKKKKFMGFFKKKK